MTYVRKAQSGVGYLITSRAASKENFQIGLKYSLSSLSLRNEALLRCVLRLFLIIGASIGVNFFRSTSNLSIYNNFHIPLLDSMHLHITNEFHNYYFEIS